MEFQNSNQILQLQQFFFVSADADPNRPALVELIDFSRHPMSISCLGNVLMLTDPPLWPTSLWPKAFAPILRDKGRTSPPGELRG